MDQACRRERERGKEMMAVDIGKDENCQKANEHERERERKSSHLLECEETG